MKSKNSYKPQNNKVSGKGILKSTGKKFGILLCIVVPISALIAYSDNMNFFSITRIISIFLLIMSVAAFVKAEMNTPGMCANPSMMRDSSSLENKRRTYYERYNTNFSFQLNKGNLQVIISTLAIILFSYLGQFLYGLI